MKWVTLPTAPDQKIYAWAKDKTIIVARITISLDGWILVVWPQPSNHYTEGGTFETLEAAKLAAEILL